MSYSSAVVRMTGIAFGRNELHFAVRLSRQERVDVASDSAFLDFPDASPVSPKPAKASRGRFLSRANQTGTFLPSMVSYSLNEVKGTRQRCSGPSQRFQCALEMLRMLRVPESRLQAEKMIAQKAPTSPRTTRCRLIWTASSAHGQANSEGFREDGEYDRRVDRRPRRGDGETSGPCPAIGLAAPRC